MKTTKETIDILNNLLETNNDRIEGYERASKETTETDLKTLFTQFASTSTTCKQELIAEVKKLGGTPNEKTSTSGKFYRTWMDIKATLTGKDRKKILASCEMGEDVAKKNYEDALKEFTSDSPLFTLINKQLILIKADHDKVKNLRDELVNV
jgi:uncharacterized protein (TIGR02284 family)